MEQLADLRLTHRGVDVRQLVVDRLYQTANGLIDTSADFLAAHTGNIAVHIDGSLFQCLSQIELCISMALPHLHALCFLDGLILRQLGRGVLAQKAFNFQVGLNFFQELCIAGKHNQNFLALTGHHTKSGIISAAVIPRSQNTNSHIVALVCLVRAVIHGLIEEESIAAIEGRVGVFLAGKNVLENHLRNLGDDLRSLHILLFNLVVDFLFLIGQENIDAAVFLHKHLPH